ncbi:MAG: response regulator, partial [Bryobacteraceae bacterium]
MVDDQPGVREALRLLLKSANYLVDLAASPREALAAASYDEHDVLLIDMNYARDTTSGQEGLALLDRLHAQRREVPIIVMTAWSTIELAVDAMHRGARDFITKPWDNARLLAILDKHLNSGAASGDWRAPIDAELAVARRVQRKLLPSPHFRAGSLECQCVCLPLGEVGGDLCDVFETSPGRVAFLLGDVSGKGIG